MSLLAFALSFLLPIEVDVDALQWRSIGPGLGEPLVSVVGDPQSARTVYVSSSTSGVWKTTDDGTTWENRSIGLPSGGGFVLEIDPSRPGVLYANTGLGAFVTRDGALNWTPLFAPDLQSPVEVASVAATSPATVFVVDGSGRLYRSADLVTWIHLDQGLPAAGGTPVAVTPDGETLYAGVFDVGLFKSTDGGSSWTETLALCCSSNRMVTGVWIDPGAPTTLFTQTLNFGFVQFWAVWRSDDGGATWASGPLPVQPSGNVSFAFDRGDPDVVLVSGSTESGTQVFLSSDRGRTWSPAADGLSPDVVRLFDGGTTPIRRVFASTESSGAYELDLGLNRVSPAHRRTREVTVRPSSSE